MGTADVEAVWRIESARIVAALTRFTGDFGLAEDAAQEAVAEALGSWPLTSPANPVGWLMATARRRAIDAIRRRTVLSVVYVIFTEGSTATSGDRLLRPGVAYEASRRGRPGASSSCAWWPVWTGCTYTTCGTPSRRSSSTRARSCGRVMELFGHSTIRMTADTDGHVLPARARQAASAIDRVLGEEGWA